MIEEERGLDEVLTGGEPDEGNSIADEKGKITTNTTSLLNMNKTTITAKSEWERETSMCDSIGEIGIQQYTNDNNIELRGVMYNSENPEHHTSCLCMDERTEGFGLNLAGSGILLADAIGFDELVKIIYTINEKSLLETGKRKIETITSHQGCGAAALYAKGKGLEGDADEYGKEFSKKLANALGLEYKHLKLSVPHTARSIYVDFTGKFSEEPKTLPNGYNITSDENFLSDNPIIKDHIVTQVEVAYSIAKLEKVHGNKINTENPFFTFIVKEKGVEIDSILVSQIKELEEKFKGELQVDILEI